MLIKSNHHFLNALRKKMIQFFKWCSILRNGIQAVPGDKREPFFQKALEFPICYLQFRDARETDPPTELAEQKSREGTEGDPAEPAEDGQTVNHHNLVGNGSGRDSFRSETADHHIVKQADNICHGALDHHRHGKRRNAAHERAVA